MSRNHPFPFNPLLSVNKYCSIRREVTTIHQSAPNRWPIGLLVVLGVLLLATPAWAQGTMAYRFSGQVSSLNQFSTIFPGISIGSPVEGVFVIDYAALDGEPAPGLGTYGSARVTIEGTIGASGFSSVANSNNSVVVENGQPGISEDWTILRVMPGGGLEELTLTFYDSTGQALSGDALPGSAAAFSAFPQMVLYARGAGFGQYSLSVAIDHVPEPSGVILGGIGLALLGVIRRGRCAADRASAATQRFIKG